MVFLGGYSNKNDSVTFGAMLKADILESVVLIRSMKEKESPKPRLAGSILSSTDKERCPRRGRIGEKERHGKRRKAYCLVYFSGWEYTYALIPTFTHELTPEFTPQTPTFKLRFHIH